MWKDIAQVRRLRKKEDIDRYLHTDRYPHANSRKAARRRGAGVKVKPLSLAAAILVVLSLITSTAANAVGEVVYVNTRLLADNLEYVNTVSWDQTLGRTESFTIRLTGSGDAYPIILKGDTVYGSTRISNLIAYAESLGKNVLATVNTDFFFPENGIPLGIVIEDGIYKSSAGGRNAVTFGYDGRVSIIEAPEVLITLRNNGGSENSDNVGETVSLRNFNKTRTDTGGLCLYSEVFSTVSTRTSSPGWFVKFRILEGTPSVSGTMTLEVTETLTSSGAIPIGEGYIVLTAADLSDRGVEYEKFAVGDIVTLSAACNDTRLANAQYATGAGDVIVSGGEVTDQAGWSPSLLARAPRTAFGLLSDGTIISYIVDGRNAEHSVGLTLAELADELMRQGCVYAVNFDGGGSTALSLRLPGDSGSSVVSRPSDGAERGCATYMLFVTDAVPDGTAKNLSMVNDGVIVLAESSVELAFTATDRGYMPAAVPDDIIASVMEAGAEVTGTTYTAGSMAGADRLSLYSPSTGAYGRGEVFVITRPTSITVTRRGSTAPLTSIRISPGETLELDVIATYYRRAVTSQVHSFEFTVTGDIGEMIEPGVFLAAQTLLQTGTITVSAGGRSTDINVEVGGFSDMINHWGREYAEYLLQAGITNGISATEYGPSLIMRRADFILMLYRAAGLPEFEDEGNFDDVPPDAYYARAMSWAKAEGIAENTDDNSFDPQSPLTRQDAFTFTYRALDILGISYIDGTLDDLTGFPDFDTIDDYAMIPTATLIRLGVVDGMNGLISPHDTLTRAQMAKVLTVVLMQAAPAIQ